ncbi:MAG: hypothetical protein HUJ57_06875, partial [Erysipelotrichaceae bacterium]|nr:hypothetical protein [Erysipelotrichaceae bacterium]
TNNGKTWTTSVPQIKNVGELKVKVKAENPKYKSVTAEYTLKVVQKDIVVKADDKSKVYGEVEPQLTATIIGMVEGESERLIKYSLKCDKGFEPGTYPIVVSGEASQGNYKVTYQNGTFTVLKKTGLTISAIDYNDAYDGRSHGGYVHPSVYVNTTLHYSTDGGQTWKETEPRIKDVGEISIKVKATNPHYEEEPETEYTIKVTPRNVTVQANNAAKTYGQNDPELSATVTGTVDNDTVDYRLARDNGEDIGTYAIRATGAEAQGNYKVTYQNGTFTINKIGDLKVVVKDYEGIYDGKVHGEAAVPSIKDNTKVEYSTDNGKSWSEIVPQIKDVGEIKVMVKATHPGYGEGNGTYTLKVTKKEVIVTTASATKVYDGKPLTAAGTISGLVDNEKAALNVTGSQTAVGSSINTYSISWGDTNKDNYKITEKLGTLTVTAPTPTPVPTPTPSPVPTPVPT